MIPSSTKTRTKREASTGRVSGRTHEIQRLIGRSLRAVLDLKKLGPRTIYMDCDVIQADGGTRTASITGSYIALCLAANKLVKNGTLASNPIVSQVAAVSVGMLGKDVLLDLDYREDSSADVDLNLVMDNEKRFIEIQGTSEREPVSLKHLDQMIETGWKGIKELFEVQNAIIEKRTL